MFVKAIDVFYRAPPNTKPISRESFLVKQDCFSLSYAQYTLNLNFHVQFLTPLASFYWCCFVFFFCFKTGCYSTAQTGLEHTNLHLQHQEI